ncbi:heparinase II/III family protein [Dietzia sp. WMMA184]|uniref:heparinase II/III domain-containing protein n=1 Tax=Dietzia sp. WMMA184 TaxID=2039808 RepID=UPI0020B10D4A|nr:heparinase II/III family protein [Dietzia sp. WMMA184]
MGTEQRIERFDGPVQKWTVNFSNGLEYCNKLSDLLGGSVRIFGATPITFDAESFSWSSVDMEDAAESTVFYLHSLKWIDQLIAEALSAGEFAEQAANLAISVAREWWTTYQANKESWENNEYIWGGHGVALRSTTLTGLSCLVGDAEWLESAMRYHLGKLVDHFDGLWNHGLAQAISMMGVAGRLNDREALLLGHSRTMDCLDAMVDAEGCINEQAPEYSRYIERLIRVAIRVFKLNNLSGIEALEAKKTLVRSFIAHSLAPDGTFVELGDSSPRRPSYMRDSAVEYALSGGQRGTVIPRFKVYKQGYVFGRSGFGRDRHADEETFYSIRFGPGRIIHGHNDHLSVTHWAAGRRIIVDPGHVGYSPGPARNYVRSHDAHNVPVVRGRKHDWSAYTDMVGFRTGENWQSVTLRDRGYPEVERQRSACFTDCGPFVVCDRVISDSTPVLVSQRWNVAREFDLAGTTVDSARFRSRRDGLVLYLVRFRIVDAAIEVQCSQELACGDETDMRGWVAEGDRLAEAWNVGFVSQGVENRIVTAGIVASPSEDVGWSYRKAGDDLIVLRVHIASRSWAFNCHIESGMVNVRVAAPLVSRIGGLKEVQPDW